MKYLVYDKAGDVELEDGEIAESEDSIVDLGQFLDNGSEESDSSVERKGLYFNYSLVKIWRQAIYLKQSLLD